MIFTVNNLSKKIDNKIIVDNINLKFKSGELIGLIGENGAGKSTFIKMITTVLKPTNGDISLDDISIIRNPKKIRRELGYLPQSFPVYDNLTIIEFLLFTATIKEIDIKLAKQQINTYMNQFHLAQSQNTRLIELSGGMLQKVGIITALLGNPKLIVLDEPANGLDPAERNNLRNLLVTLAKDKIIIYSTHIIADVEQVASRIIIMNQGNVVFDGTDKKIINTIKGKIWEFYLEDESRITSEYFVVSIKSATNRIKLRVVSNNKPHEDAILVNEILEDAYLHFISSGGDMKNGYHKNP